MLFKVTLRLPLNAVGLIGRLAYGVSPLNRRNMELTGMQAVCLLKSFSTFLRSVSVSERRERERERFAAFWSSVLHEVSSARLVTQMSVLNVVDQLLQGFKLNATSIEFARIYEKHRHRSRVWPPATINRGRERTE